ncbi:MAG: exonuclease domain-containing protein [Parachlamydiales bacterium]|jgi:DNA polymerase-3 subunit epsilon/oligoribonuclease
MLAIFLDIETNGLDARKHSPIEIAFTIMDVTENKNLVSYQSVISLEEDAWGYTDPRSLLINGFSWDKARAGKSMKTVSQEIIACFQAQGIKRGHAVFICQNPTFDRAFFSLIIDVYTQEALNWPYHWLDMASMYWALKVKELQSINQPFVSEISLSKNDIAAKYNLPPEKEPHNAMQGVNHLIKCYEAVLGVVFTGTPLNKQ